MTNLGTLGGSWVYPSAMNEQNQVVGASSVAANKSDHAFRWDPNDGMADLGTFGGDTSRANGDIAQVVGSRLRAAPAGW
jgi:probable HAF family extracellular repeat protein